MAHVVGQQTGALPCQGLGLHGAQVVLVPSVFLLVPGSVGFRGMSSLLGRDTITGVETTFAMFVVAMAIVAGLLIANATVSPRRVL